MKTGTDADADQIALQSTTPTSIAALDGLTAPASLPASTRVQPTETTVFQVHATLTQYKIEADSDYHLVLSDGAGHTMIGEILDPSCVGSASPLRGSSRRAARYHPHRLRHAHRHRRRQYRGELFQPRPQHGLHPPQR